MARLGVFNVLDFVYVFGSGAGLENGACYGCLYNLTDLA